MSAVLFQEFWQGCRGRLPRHPHRPLKNQPVCGSRTAHQSVSRSPPPKQGPVNSSKWRFKGGLFHFLRFGPPKAYWESSSPFHCGGPSAHVHLSVGPSTTLCSSKSLASVHCPGVLFCLVSHVGLNLGDVPAAGEQLEKGTCWASDSWWGHSDVLKLFPGLTARVSGLLLICLFMFQ